jgi:pheromone shutdown protein TraB
LRAEDSLMNVSLVEEFINNMQAMWMKLEINENDLNELLSNDKEKLSFQNIVKQGAKYYSKD